MATRRQAPVSRRASRDPYGIGPARALVAPVFSAFGLLVVAAFTAGLLTGRLPFVPAGGGNGSTGGGNLDITPAPSNVVNIDTRVSVPGSIVYVKSGNLWIQSGKQVTQITEAGHDSMPTFSFDGQWIYFIETVEDRAGFFPVNGAPRHYTLTYPVISRVRPDGSGREQVATGLYKSGGGRYTWFYWLRQPVPAPDSKTLALLSDGPDPTRSDVVLQLMDIESGKLEAVDVPERQPLGHQDPAWRHDGKILLYVKNDRDGSRGAPSIYRWFPKNGKTTSLTGPGYTSPAWSPDGRFVAATKTGSLGTDVVILDAKNGQELVRLTSDGHSWGPAWSPAGDAVAYLHIVGQIVDLKMVRLEGAGPSWKIGQTVDLTTSSGLEGASRPSWYMPLDQLPATAPPPTPRPASPTPTPS